MTTVDREEVIILTEALMDGSIDAEQFAVLEAWLKKDPAARALYLEHCSVDALLRWRWQGEAEQLVVPANKVVSFPASRSVIKVALAVAAVIALLLSLPMFLKDQSGVQVFATVTAQQDAQWRVVSGEDDGLGMKTLLVTKGSLQVDFVSGAQAVLFAPSLFEVSGENAAVLEWGKGSFLVPKQAVGYTVGTPWGKVIDLGTAFDLTVSNDGLAEVSVTEGRVRVVSKGEQRELGLGDSLSMTRSGLGDGEQRGVDMGAVSDYGKMIRAAKPVAYWPFDGEVGDLITEKGVVKLVPGPRPPEFKLFAANNTAAFFGDGGILRKQDLGGDSGFDFDNGDEISIEAWVNPERQVKEGGIVYIVGKGRTNNLSFLKDNQNFSLRLWRKNGQMKASFLFRSAPDGDWEGDYHRWTALRGFVAGDGWHHIAVSYRYGDPDSIRTYQDGELVVGEWDMGGATTRRPVVDDDELWLGSAQGGRTGNKFTGMVDEVAIYRQILTEQEIAARVQRGK
ncbi:MAG: LamG domain-containing protein [Verrucomicrobiales bacterium]|nr:LamG domain-containing protein [Verrucomicrobiales bacterium]